MVAYTHAFLPFPPTTMQVVSVLPVPAADVRAAPAQEPTLNHPCRPRCLRPLTIPSLSSPQAPTAVAFSLPSTSGVANDGQAVAVGFASGLVRYALCRVRRRHRPPTDDCFHSPPACPASIYERSASGNYTEAHTVNTKAVSQRPAAARLPPSWPPLTSPIFSSFRAAQNEALSSLAFMTAEPAADDDKPTAGASHPLLLASWRNNR